MISKEEFEKFVNAMKDKLDDQTQALISDELVAINSSYGASLNEFENLQNEYEKLLKEKDELIKVNGKLYQRIGFEKEEKDNKIDDKKEEKIKVEEVIDEKGDII